LDESQTQETGLSLHEKVKEETNGL